MAERTLPPRLRVVAGPGYWSARAVMKRAAWAAAAHGGAADEEAIVAELVRRTPRRGMRKRLAHELGLSTAQLSGVISRRIPVSRRLAERLGYQLVAVKAERRFERVG